MSGGVVGRATLVLDGDNRGLLRTISGAQGALRGVSRLGLGVGAAITAAAGAVATGTGLAIKATSDFESSFAGVRKTVNATESEFAALSQGFRAMAREIPVNVNELNRIGEAAGQLGIRTENILEFTKTMAELGVTTNLSAEQAAISLARFSNVMGVAQSDIERIGSSVVDLGNNFATSEAEIVDFTSFMAGAAKSAGLAATDVLAIGAAMSDVGVRAEAGGGAVQKALLSMTEAVAVGNEDLQVFAATAGMTSSEFARTFREDASEAFTAFVEGIGRQGTDAFETLRKLEFQDIRLIRAFLSLSAAGDRLRTAFDTANTAFAENTALSKEAAERFKTFQSQLQLLKNDINDLFMRIGDRLLPVVRDFVGEVRGFIDREGQQLVEVIGVFLIEAIDVAISALGFLERRVRDIKLAVNALGAQVTKLKLGDLELEREATTARIERLQETIDNFDPDSFTGKLSGMVGGLEANKAALEESIARLAEIDAQIQTAEGALSGFEEQFNDARSASGEFQRAIEKIRDLLGRYREMVQNSGEATGELGEAMEEAAEKLDWSVPARELEGSLGSARSELMRFLTSVTGLTTVQVRFLEEAGNTSAEIVRYGRLLDHVNPKIRNFAREQLGLNEEMEKGGSAFARAGQRLQASMDQEFAGNLMANIFSELVQNERALGRIGSAIGSTIGAAVAGPIGAAVGSLLGPLLEKLFPTLEDIRADRITGQFAALGRVSESTAESVGKLSAEFARQMRPLSNVAAGLVKLGDILRDTGIEDTRAFQFASEKAREVVERFTEGILSEREAVDTLNDVIPQLVDNLDHMTESGRRSFRSIIESAREAGLEIQALNDLVRGAISGVAEGVGKILGPGKRVREELAAANEEFDKLLEGGVTGDEQKRLEELAARIAELQNVPTLSSGDAAFAAQGLVAGFQELVAQGVSASEAFDILGPQMRELQAQAAELGIELPEPFRQLQNVMRVLSQEDVAALQQRIDGMGQVMQSLLEIGIKPTAEQFATFQGNATAAFQQLRDQGLSAQDAFVAMADDFKLLARLQNDFGFEVDEATKKIFEEAGATDLLRSEGLDTQDILERGFEGLFDRLDELIRTFGGTVSDEFKRIRDDAGIAATGVADHFRPLSGLNIPINVVPRMSGSLPGFENGSDGFRDFDSGTLAMLHGREAVVTEGRSSARSGQPLVVQLVDRDGRVQAEQVVPHIEDYLRDLGVG